jgi:hypothetical protein
MLVWRQSRTRGIRRLYHSFSLLMTRSWVQMAFLDLVICSSCRLLCSTASMNSKMGGLTRISSLYNWPAWLSLVLGDGPTTSRELRVSRRQSRAYRAKAWDHLLGVLKPTPYTFVWRMTFTTRSTKALNTGHETIHASAESGCLIQSS